MFAFGIGKEVITIADRGICEARREVEPGVFKGWVKPVVDERLAPGFVLERFEFRIRKADVVRVWIGRPQTVAEVRAERSAAYPSIGDQLDAIAKGFAALTPESLPQETRDWLAQLAAVKAAHPKPESQA